MSKCLTIIVFGVLAISILAQEQSRVPQNTLPTVTLNMIATDDSNHAVDDVTKEEVSVFDEKAPQTILNFGKDDRRMQYVIAIDSSGSFKNLFGSALNAVRLMIDNNRDVDETMLIRFVSSDKIETVEKFTSDRSKLVTSLGRLRIEDGQSAVIDAIYVAVQTVAAYKADDPGVRRAVVLFTDGEDRASYYNLDQLIKLLHATNVQVFAIAIVTQLSDSSGLIRKSPRETAEGLLNRVALETGGRVFYSRTTGDLANSVRQLSHDLQNQYRLTYQPGNITGEDKFRKVRISIGDSPGHRKLKAISRSGYFINPPDFRTREGRSKPKA